ncbi:MAG: hypothetical protein ABI823_11245 [Bryobacteraceae bacterium]
MATLATLYNRFVTARSEDRGRAEIMREQAIADYRLPAVPFEDVYWFVKRVNNSQVMRAADPAARSVCWRLLGGTGLVVLALTAVLLPSVSNLFAGFQYQSLVQEKQRLDIERASLELQLADATSPAKVQSMAAQRGFGPPTADKVVYLDVKTDGSLSAKNTR